MSAAEHFHEECQALARLHTPQVKIIQVLSRLLNVPYTVLHTLVMGQLAPSISAFLLIIVLLTVLFQPGAPSLDFSIDEWSVRKGEMDILCAVRAVAFSSVHFRVWG